MDLSELLSPISLEVFLNDLDHQRFRHITGNPDRLNGLFSWREANRFLAEHRLSPPRVRLASGGAILPPERYFKPITPDSMVSEIGVRELQSEVRAGATLVMDSVDEIHNPLTQLAMSIERTVGVHAQSNAYASFGTTNGFPLHWDDHHVLVLQLQGRKAWSIFGTTRDYPLKRDVVRLDAPTAPVWEGVLERGDVLYVPRGVWHLVTALAEPSLHITIGIPNRTGIDLMGWLVDEVLADEVFRRDLPRFGSVGERRARTTQLREALLARLDDDVIDRYFHSFDANAKPRRQFSLPWSVTRLPEGDGLRLQITAPRRLRIHEGDDGSITVEAIGQRFRFAGACRPLLDALDDGAPHTIGALQAVVPALPRSQLRAFLGELLRLGLVATVDLDGQ